MILAYAVHAPAGAEQTSAARALPDPGGAVPPADPEPVGPEPGGAVWAPWTTPVDLSRYAGAQAQRPPSAAVGARRRRVPGQRWPHAWPSDFSERHHPGKHPRA